MLFRSNQYSTIDLHMPPDHLEYMQWNGDRFRNWAKQIGESTTTVAELFLTAHRAEQQGYKSCMALLKLADKYSSKRLENACYKALTYTPTPSLKSVQAILKSGQDKLIETKQEELPRETSQYSFTRGAEYYRRKP